MDQVVLILKSGKVSIMTLPRNEINSLREAFISYKNNTDNVAQVHAVHNNTEMAFIDLDALAIIQVQYKKQ